MYVRPGYVRSTVPVEVGDRTEQTRRVLTIVPVLVVLTPEFGHSPPSIASSTIICRTIDLPFATVIFITGIGWRQEVGGPEGGGGCKS